ncbi:MAG: sulfurtransferase [Chryseolinea sp.]
MPIINADEFLRTLDQPQVIVIDARGGADATLQYRTAHVLGALRIDLETELSAKTNDAADGGRHPLPQPARFSEVLSRLGISPDSRVVVYDDKCGANAAARFWWMMKSAGHGQIDVVGAAIERMRKAGVPFTSDESIRPLATSYHFDRWSFPIATMQEVERASTDHGQMIIDVRENYRYRGEKEPIDLIAGHIPGSVNVPYTENLTDKGDFLDAVDLISKYKDVTQNFAPQQVIVHCGSGVTACHTLLAMHSAGLEGAKLYVGSWSEWSRNGNEIATEY